MKFSKRMDNFGEGIFSQLLALKMKRLETGLSVVDLSVGTPNIPPARHIMEAISNAALEPSNYIYSISDTGALTKAVSVWYQNRYGVMVDPDTEVCSLLGSQEGLAHIAMTIADAGDIVLVPDPCYPVFADGPKLAGAKLHYMSQRAENEYLIDVDEIPSPVAKQAKLMIVSYPNNPTTAVAPDSFYRKLIDFAKGNDIIVLHDNAYSELTFDGINCGSFLRFPGAKDVGVEFNSLSKTYGLAGARIGFCIGNRHVVSQLKMLKSNIDYGMFLPIQKGAIAAITGDQSCVSQMRKEYESRRNLLCDGLTKLGWHVHRSPATMFVWAKIPEGYATSSEFCMELVEKAGVLMTPGSAFGPSGEGYVRMALVQSEEKIAHALLAIEESRILSDHLS